MNALTRLDWIGLAVWALLWLAYAVWADRAVARRPSLMASLAHYRRVWMREAYRRDNRIADVTLIGSLMQSATFFSSTTLLILGGLFAILGTIEKSAEVLQGLPFASRTTQELLEIKALGMGYETDGKQHRIGLELLFTIVRLHSHNRPGVVHFDAFNPGFHQAGDAAPFERALQCPPSIGIFQRN